MNAAEAGQHVAALGAFLEERGVTDTQALLVLLMAAGKLGGALQFSAGMTAQEGDEAIKPLWEVFSAGCGLHREQLRLRAKAGAC